MMTDADQQGSGLKTKRPKVQFAWALYDFANSAYVLLIIAFAFPLFFKYLLASGSGRGDFLWGLALGGSVLLGGISAPLVGAYADVFGRHRYAFRIFVSATILGTASLALLQPGQLGLGMLLFVGTNACFNVSTALYDSYLLRVSDPKRIGSVSGLAWGIGYLGGILCLLLVFPLVTRLDDQSVGSYRAIFVVVALWYLVFSLPVLRTLPTLEPSPRQARLLARFGWRYVFILVYRTLKRTRRRYPAMASFIIGYYFLTDATGTLTNFASLFMRDTLQFSTTKIGIFLVAVQVVAVPSTILSGRLADRRGPKFVVLAGTLGWMIGCIWLFLARTAGELYVLTGLIGIVIGSTYAAARSLFALVAPRDRLSLAFGFNALSGRVAETFAPIIFGSVSTVTGSQRMGVLSMLPFLLLGFFLIARVRAPALADRH